ncbi:MAG: enoyl-CoA hydratase [Microscillaceae bacterium]|jgi:2-(1,2-epoxy-1,2-dihydrophenyl)acetyl-CoA isomerase|nr:enoyl-CoA hydratase [Microscillaceae bacterium]
MNQTSVATEPKILVSLENRIKTITINNPKAKNAVGSETAKELCRAITSSFMDDTRVIILTGAEGNFCSGADVSADTMNNPKEYDVTKYLRETINPIILNIRNLNIPVIAKVRGVAAGVGCNFALACDMVFATPTAMFSQIFTNIGLSSDGGGAYFMTKMVGYKKAFELMATAAKITAPEALAMNMINHIYSETDIDEEVQKMAEKLANGPFIAIQQTKANLREANSGSLETTLDMEAVNQANNFQSNDFVEGVSAFIQKRKPNFKGE